MSLEASFLDMTGSSAGMIFEEAAGIEGLPQDTKDALQGLVNLERSRGHVVLHLLSLASTLDPNVKLLRRQILSISELQPHLLQIRVVASHAVTPKICAVP